VAVAVSSSVARKRRNGRFLNSKLDKIGLRKTLKSSNLMLWGPTKSGTRAEIERLHPEQLYL
jgi:hypothetical protein